MPEPYDKITLGGIATLILMFVAPWQEFMSWITESLFGAIIATFFFSPLMAYLMGEDRTIHEKTLFATGALLYVVFYLLLGDPYHFIVFTLQGIVLYSFVTVIVVVIYKSLAKKLP